MGDHPFDQTPLTKFRAMRRIAADRMAVFSSPVTLFLCVAVSLTGTLTVALPGSNFPGGQLAQAAENLNQAAQNTEGQPAATAEERFPELKTESAIDRLEAVFLDTPADVAGLRRRDIERWLTTVNGEEGRLVDAERNRFKTAGFQGLVKLAAPWTADTVLRFAPFDHDQTQLLFWRGNAGVAIHYHQHPRPTWIAYRTARSGKQPRPETYAMVASDGSRYLRSGMGRLEIRHQAAELVLSHGDLVLLRAPLPEHPEEVYLARGGWFRSFGAYRCGPIPDSDPELGPMLWDSRTLAPEDWQRNIAAGGDLRFENGRPEPGPDTDTPAVDQSGQPFMQLVAHKTQEPVSATTPVPDSGCAEFLLQIRTVTSHSAIEFLDGQDRPLFSVAFLRDTRLTDHVSVALLRGDESRRDSYFDVNQQPSPVIAAIKPGFQQFARETWLKVVPGSGGVHLSISPDGKHWSTCCDPLRDLPLGPVRRLRLICYPGTENSQLTVGRLQLRELPALAALASAELRRRVPEAVYAHSSDFANWYTAVLTHQPADASVQQWRHACILRTLAVRPSSQFANTQLRGILEDFLPVSSRQLADPVHAELIRQQKAGLPDAAAVFKDVVRLYDAWDGWSCQSLVDWIHRYSAVAAMQPKPVTWTSINRLLAESELLTNQTEQRFAPQTLARQDMLFAIAARDWQRAWTVARRIRFWTAASHPDWDWPWDLHELRPFVLWTESVAGRRVPLAVRGAVPLLPMPVSWRHPITLEPDKASTAALAELESAVSDRAANDACRVLASLTPQNTSGLVASPLEPSDSQGPRHLLSLAREIARRTPAEQIWRQAMKSDMTAIGTLRLQAAAARSDPAAVAAVATEFSGTDLAVDAWTWIADRNIAAGEFSQAAAAIESAMTIASDEARVGLRARWQLILAATGRGGDSGLQEPAAAIGAAGQSANDSKPESASAAHTASSPHVTGNGLSSAAITAAIQQFSAPGSRAAGIDPETLAAATAVIGQKLVPEARGRWDGDHGHAAGQPASDSVDWVARQLATTAESDQLLVSNRFQVTSMDLAAGSIRWSTGLGNDMGEAHRWPLVSTKPVVWRGQVFVRQMARETSILRALKFADGTPQWQTPVSTTVISDPFVIDDRLYALTATGRSQGSWQIALTRFAPNDGMVLMRKPLVTATDLWDGHLSAWVTPTTSGFVACVAGSVFSCDTTGRIHWIRRQELWPPAGDWKFFEQSGSAPAFSAGKIIAFQPGTFVVQQLDRETGSELAHAAIADVRRVIATTPERVLVEARSQLIGLDSQAQLAVAWQLAVPLLLDAVLSPDGNTLLAAARDLSQADKPRIQLLFVDPMSGSVRHVVSLDTLNDQQSWLGPMVFTRNGLWSFYGRNLSQPQRDVLRLLPTGTLPSPAPGFYPSRDFHLPETLVETRLQRAIDETFPGWKCLASGNDGRCGFLAEFAGEKDIIVSQTSVDRHARLVRNIMIPPGEPRLYVRAGHASGQHWRCTVRVNGKILSNEQIDSGGGSDGWKSWSVGLKEFAGTEVTLLLEQSCKENSTLTYLNELTVRNAN